MPNGKFHFFEDILSPKAGFMKYYASQNIVPTLTDDQKEILKTYAFRSGQIFDNMHLLKILYDYRPTEIKDFVQAQFSAKYLSEESMLIHDYYDVKRTLKLLLLEEAKLSDVYNVQQLDIVGSYDNDITLNERVVALRFLLEQLSNNKK